jgi:CheY-like chemotaxis protein
MNILLVDDDEDDVEMFQEALKVITKPVNLAIAHNGIEALEVLSSSDEKLPTLIFMDLNMPLMDGLKCLEAIRANEKFSSIPVLMHTTSISDRMKDKCIALGADCHIKPNSFKDLVDFVAQRLEISRPKS